MCLFTITLKLEILVDLYLGDLISKSVFKNDVFAIINLKNLQYLYFSSFLYECCITVFMVVLLSLIQLWI